MRLLIFLFCIFPQFLFAQLSFALDTSYFVGETISKLSHSPDGNTWCIKGANKRQIGYVNTQANAADLSSYFANVTTSQFTAIQAFDSATSFISAENDYLYKLSSLGLITKFDTASGLKNKNLNSVLLGNFDYSLGNSHPNNLLEKRILKPKLLVVGTDSGVYASEDFKHFFVYDEILNDYYVKIQYAEKDFLSFTINSIIGKWNVNIVNLISRFVVPDTYVGYYENYINYYGRDNRLGQPDVEELEINCSVVNLFKTEHYIGIAEGFLYWGTKHGLTKCLYSFPTYGVFGQSSDQILLSNQEVYALKLAPFRTVNNGYLDTISNKLRLIKRDKIINRYLFVGADSGFYYAKANYNQQYRSDLDTLHKVSILGTNFSKVYDIAVDTSGCGYLWLATDNGLHKLRVNFEKDIIYEAIQPQGRINICDRNIQLQSTLSSASQVQWQRDGENLLNLNTQTIITTVPGSYRFSVQNALVNTECYSKEVKLVRDTAVTFNYPNLNQSICKGDTFKLKVQTDTAYVYAWYRNHFFTGLTDSIIHPTLDGWYDVKVTNCYKRSAFSDSTLLVYSKIAKPDLFSMKKAICVDDSTSLFITATGFNTQWQIDGIVDSSYANKTRIRGVPFKNYEVYIKDTIGCVANSDIKTIGGINFPSLSLLAENKGILCKGTPLTLQAVSTSLQLLWSTGAATPQITIAEEGHYIVKTWFDTTCKAVDTVKIIAVDPPTFKLKSDTVFCFGELLPIQLTAPKGFSTYLWNETKTEENTYVTYKAEVVSLLITDMNNCTVSSAITIQDKCSNLKIPNIFTPNNDGVNDVFEIQNLIPNSELSVFNRWGTIVYSTPNYNNNWKAEGLTDGIYYYSLFDTYYNTKYKGWLEIAR